MKYNVDRYADTVQAKKKLLFNIIRLKMPYHSRQLTLPGNFKQQKLTDETCNFDNFL